jgi:rod shape-determining protein MreC
MVEYIYAPFFFMKHRIAASAHVFEENRLLRQRLADMSIENQRLRESKGENDRLRRLLELSPAWRANSIPAEVVAPISPGSGVIWIDIGDRDDIQVGWPVATEEGLVGKIVDVTDGLARVRTLWDHVSRVAAYDQRSRTKGIVAWDRGRNLDLTYVLPTADVRAGDSVLSSGWGGVFPKGLRIGVVTAVDTVRGGTYLEIDVAPVVEPERLELVFVVEPQPGDFDTILEEPTP